MNRFFNLTRRVSKTVTYITALCVLLLFSSCTDFIADIDLQKDWEIYENEKIVLHYRPYEFSSTPSPNLEEIKTILKNQNFYYQIIQDSIHRVFRDKVLIYIFNKDEAKELIGTNGGGHSIPKFNTFYYTYINKINEYTDQYGIKSPLIGAHELVHVITHRTIGYPGTKLMSEGYAVWLDRTFAGKNIIDIIRFYKDNQPNKVLTPDQLLNEFTDIESIYYPNCGVFVAYLINTYGIEKINTLFISSYLSFKNDFEYLTNDNWENMSIKYLNYLNNL